MTNPMSGNAFPQEISIGEMEKEVRKNDNTIINYHKNDTPLS